MKQMKSYRMGDVELAMIDRIKQTTKLKTDTDVISFAIMNLYYEQMVGKEETEEYARVEDLRDRS